MRQPMLRGLIAALVLIAAVSPESSAQTGAVRPIQLRRQAAESDTDALARMTLHLQQMEAANDYRPPLRGQPNEHANHLETMVPRHTRLLTAMLKHFSSSRFGLTDKSERMALELSLEEDLARIPELSREEFQAFLPEHAARVKRLIEIHRGLRRLR